jgi:hypothetical protein
MAGRKRKPGHREPSGKARRVPAAVLERQNTSVALEARQRVFGVTEAKAKKMRETTFLGYLRSLGRVDGISYAQWEGAKWYEDARARLARLMPVAGYPTPGNYAGPRGYNEKVTQADIDAYDRAEADCAKARRALAVADAADHRVSAVVERVVINGYWMPHQIGPLRLGLNELARLAKADDLDESDVDPPRKAEAVA